jgi:hypothetical protein
MTRETLKKEISKIIDNMPDRLLEQVYKALKGFKPDKSSKIDPSKHLDRILQEDKGLLDRLAK